MRRYGDASARCFLGGLPGRLSCSRVPTVQPFASPGGCSASSRCTSPFPAILATV